MKRWGGVGEKEEREDDSKEKDRWVGLLGTSLFFVEYGYCLYICWHEWMRACERACISIWSKNSPADGSILFGHAPYLFEGGVYLSLIKIRSTICCATLCAMCCVCLLIAITTTQKPVLSWISNLYSNRYWYEYVRYHTHVHHETCHTYLSLHTCTHAHPHIKPYWCCCCCCYWML